MSDPFYGREEIAFLCAQTLFRWFALPGSSTVLPDVTLQARRPLARFIAYIIYRTRTPDIIVFASMHLLERLRACVDTARGQTGYRLFITALVLAWKLLSDNAYSSGSWAKVSRGLFTAKGITRMEIEMCTYLGWRLHIDLVALTSYEGRLRRPEQAPAGDAAPTLTPTSSVIPTASSHSMSNPCSAGARCVLDVVPAAVSVSSAHRGTVGSPEQNDGEIGRAHV